jgi:hypothetical protein
MSHGHDAQESQNRVAEAAANYAPRCPPKYDELMQFKESIATLRRKGASYRTIMDILHTVKVSVSLDTVARFCREVIEQRQPRKIKRRPTVRPLSEPATEPPRPAHPPDSRIAAGHREAPKPAPPDDAPVRSKGPRIADPANV